ncbi:MAG: c-type cytochrome [Pseudobdellovibrio sp.]
MKKILNIVTFKKVITSEWVLTCLFLILSGCNMDKSKPNVELIQDMMDSPAIKSQEYDESSPNNAGMRVPPEGTQPQGFEPYKYATNVEGAAKNVNPLAGSYTEETLKTGQKYYTIQCAVCHGAKGEGGEKMPVAETMALKPPAMTSDKIKGWTDGQIYHVITMGQGVMGPYASHIPAKYRWQVVNYIRHLQGKGN